MCSRQDFEKIIGKNLIEQIYRPEKFKSIIELQAFTNMYYEINLILSHFGYFLRVSEFKKKFRAKKSCLIQKFSGFSITSI